MKAKLKRLHSPDIDLQNHWPAEPDCFGFILQFFAGPENESGDESFDLMVCTPRWLEKRESGRIFFGSNLLIVKEYNLDRIETFLNRFCEHCTGESWLEVADKLGRVARWEFDSYQAFAGSPTG